MRAIAAGRAMGTVRARAHQVSVVVPILTLVLLALVTTPRFNNPDDVFFYLSLDGTFWGEPTGDLVFVRPILTDVLAWLYGWATAVAWYSLLLVVMQLVAWILLLYAFLRHRASESWFGWVAAAAVAGGIGLRLWMTMQFSSTAGLLIVAGIVLHGASEDSDGTDDSEAPAEWLGRAAVGGLAAGCGGLLRWELLPVLLIVAGAWLVLARPIRERRQSHLLFLGIVLGITALGWLHQADKYGGSEAWSDYLSYNSVRGNLHDSPGLDGLEDVPQTMRALGWTENDIELFSNFSVLDQVVFSETNLDALHDEVGGDRRSLADAFRKIDFRHPLMFVIAAIVGSVALLTADWLGRLGLVAGGVAAGAFVLYSGLYLHLPFYILAPVMLLLATMAILRPPPEHRGVAIGAAGLLTLATIGSVVQIQRDNDRNDEQADGLVAFMEELDDLDPDGTFFIETPVPIEFISPLDTSAVPDIDMFAGSWFVGSPHYRARLASFGDGSVIDIALTDRHVYIVTGAARAEQYQAFVDQHLGGDISLVPALNHRFDQPTDLVALTGATGSGAG